MSASLSSFVIRICSKNSPERAPCNPARVPDATEQSWHGLPPQMMSTGGSSAPLSFVISPTCIMSGKCVFVTSMGNGSISEAHTGVMPFRAADAVEQAAHCKFTHAAAAFATVFVILIAVCAV